jgi:hypothetical protein
MKLFEEMKGSGMDSIFIVWPAPGLKPFLSTSDEFNYHYSFPAQPASLDIAE